MEKITTSYHRKRVSIIRTTAVKEHSVLYDSRKIVNSETAAELGRLILKDADREYVVVCCLDTKNQPVSLEIVAIGTTNMCLVGMKEVFRYAILSNAVKIIVFHNHPSGDSTPSKEDFSVTERIRKSGILLGIQLIDHIILGDGVNFTSMAEEMNWKQGEDTDGQVMERSRTWKK